ncbi:type VI secretion system-associated FHA domain protein TagH [Paraburkholderia sp. CNPSo 3272]|uniref:type VI secretion system-associated FHA domain protein TagH n=1 Tax=Paraburkholderia sp. CNPSo 3272 TaxID=2940931 RepID=UPI0020B7F302|nr:type VI secretion system-associated FHA domain protein TagH [Paraburkholderia sp. CNPSo 3272]MCP3725612.1 type VI secretion system-associated FHA domain protein TagH [Paraburkholderia sp. CNPSo 3272]
MRLTLTVEGGEAGEHAAPRTIEIDDRATIGRAPESTVVLGDVQRGISRLQASVERRGDTYVLVDAGSNPTLLNGEALNGAHEAVLSHGDQIRIGAYTLAVSIEKDEESRGPFDQTLMTQPTPPAQARAASLPGTPEFEAPPGAPLIPDDWDAPRICAAPRPQRDDAPFTPDPLAAMPLLREPGHFGGEANQALLDVLGSADPLRDAPARVARAPAAPSRSFEHVSPEKALAALPAHRSDDARAAAPETRPAAPRAEDSAVLDALLDGLGIAMDDVAHLSAPELARLTGALLREATQGTMSVLRSRAMARREARIAMTMIEARDNNPLKFFPDADRALTQMLGARGRGYLAPDEALRAAYRDIQAHELALVAGMRAAFEDAMARLDPAAIEGSLDAPAGLEALVGNRRARLWQRFVKTWEHVSRDAGDDFQQRFGEPFNRAYQAQLDALQIPKD